MSCFDIRICQNIDLSSQRSPSQWLQITLSVVQGKDFHHLRNLILNSCWCEKSSVAQKSPPLFWPRLHLFQSIDRKVRLLLGGRSNIRPLANCQHLRAHLQSFHLKLTVPDLCNTWNYFYTFIWIAEEIVENLHFKPKPSENWSYYRHLTIN